MIAALYVDVERGPYPAIIGAANCYGIERDATKYRGGGGPVILHPPCAHWSRLRALATSPSMHCGPIAVRQLRRLGGVLEHPADSGLFRWMGLPLPGAFGLDGSWTIEVEQVRWGHQARKRTWLCFKGISPADLPPMPPPREPTHMVDDGAARMAGRESRLPKMDGTQNHITPEPFARWLVDAVGAFRAEHMSNPPRGVQRALFPRSPE